MVDVAVILLTLNESLNLPGALENLSGFASEIWVVDSFSTDDTVSIALQHGASVAQRPFRGFGDQWNFAVQELPIKSSWTMKVDPDERLTDELKASIKKAIRNDSADALAVTLRLWFMGQPLTVKQRLLRVWRTGSCRFSDVAVNEHPLVVGKLEEVAGDLNHLDSPNLHHWYQKQNSYTTAEAFRAATMGPLSAFPSPWRPGMRRRMWLKANYTRIPFRHFLFQCYCLFLLGAWRSGRNGRIWARMRADVQRMIETKELEMRLSNRYYGVPASHAGAVDPRAVQYD